MSQPKPPIDFTKPVEGFLRLTAHGHWLYKGEPITHPGLIKILESNYGPDDEGAGYLVFLHLPQGTQKVRVELEDCPYFIRDVDLPATGEARVHLQDGSSEPLTAEKVILKSDGRAYIQVKGRARARFLRQAELRLSQALEEHDGRLGLRLGETWAPINAEP